MRRSLTQPLREPPGTADKLLTRAALEPMAPCSALISRSACFYNELAP